MKQYGEIERLQGYNEGYQTGYILGVRNCSENYENYIEGRLEKKVNELKQVKE